MEQQDNERKEWVTKIIEKSCRNLGFEVFDIQVKNYRVLARVPLGSINITLMLKYSEDSTASDIHDDIFASLSTHG